MRQLVRASALAFVAAAALVCGCGGGGPSTPGTSGGQGRVVLTIQFPPVPTRFLGTGGIPIGTNAVKVSITDPTSGADLAQPQLVPRSGSSSTATVTFPLIRTGAIQVTATAYADTAGTQPLGMGQVSGVVTAGGTTTLDLPLTLGPIASLVITPTSLQLIAAPGGTGAVRSRGGVTRQSVVGGVSSATIHAEVLDSSTPPNQLLGFPISWTSSDTTVATVTPSGADSSDAVVQAVGFGTAVITATELNTGKSATITVSVPLVATLNMTIARYYHTATLLANSNDEGMVLITGGAGPQGTAIPDAELYNPSGRSFSSVSPMNYAREGQTATLFPNNGTVLIAGGEDTSGAILSTVELFDPGTNSFTFLDTSMTSSRAFHTATLLNDGTVLIAGGEASPNGVTNSLNSAEIFTPPFRFSPTAGSLSTARAHAADVALGDGTVLIIGGDNIVSGVGAAVKTIEQYDPTTGMFKTVGALNTARSSPTATLLPDGNVLITGGDDPATGAVYATAEVFNPGSGSIVKTATMSVPRSGHRATLLNNGTVLISGGVSSTNGSVNPPPTAEIYTPATNTFSGVITMTSVRSNHTSTLLDDGTVLLAGGVDRFGRALPTAEVYHP
ncbi:MAG TPA: kelch repeat-containing protein [Armatimonadota bacterium]|nr:kelch repeat-containing protein [Armatimonadota bacterium]